MSSTSPKPSPDAVRAFLIETHEVLEHIETDLLVLERDSLAGDITPAVTRMFRMLHSIKGSCGFLGYPKLEELAHVGESLLGRIREGILPVDGTVASALLSIIDAIREVLTSIESENNEGDRDFSSLTQHVTQISDSGTIDIPLAINGATPARAAPLPTEDFVKPPGPPTQPAASHVSSPNFAKRPSTSPAPQHPAPLEESAAVDQSGSMAFRRKTDSSAPELDGATSTPQSSTSWASRAADSGRAEQQAVGNITDSTLRIDVALLDRMMLLAGDLVLTRNQILQDASLERDTQMHGVFRQLNAITSELQGCIMRSRMQPISTIWKQMPRMVRDMALAAFKQVRLEMEGGETELDKTVIEAVRDPLKHVLRNAVDHGIQLPELRVALGKPAEGRIWMRAYHAGGQVNIEVVDDGGGIDAQAIRRIALEQNLVPPAQLNQMNDSELLNLIFRPGFSTARQVTKLSGRGVGMDVVQTNIEKLGGTIRVQSTVGQGTSFTLQIPLTLAIVQALIVKTTGDFYAVPQSRVVECIRFRGEEATAARNASNGAPMFRFRGLLTPVVYLHELLRLPPADLTSTPLSLNLIVVKVGDRHFGLVVDQIIDSKEIVIKPIWQPLRAITTYAGATQLSDGTIALILDPVGLAKLAGIVAERQNEKPAAAQAPPEPAPLKPILLARLNRGERVALATSGLKRLMKVQCSRIKTRHGQDFMELDGRITRVVDIAPLLGQGPPTANEPSATPGTDEPPSTYIALYDVNGDKVGLNVGPSVDIIQSTLDVRGKATRPHVDFTAMIGHELVEVIDVDGILGLAGTNVALATVASGD